MDTKAVHTHATFPEEYFITYAANKEKDTLVHVTRARDAKGRIYFKSEFCQLLFVPSNGGYRAYRIEPNGMMVLESDKYFTQAHILEETKEFTQYAEKATAQQIGKARHLEDAIVAGRACNVYEVEVHLAVFSQKFRCAVDRETGLCMKWGMDADLNGFQLSGPGGFTCTEFYTEDVARLFPSIKP